MNPGVTIWRIYFGSRLLRVFTSDVRYWPKADMSCCAARVRFRGQSRHGLLHCTCLLLTESGHHVCPAKYRIRAQNGPLNSYTVCFVVPSHLVPHTRLHSRL